MANSILTTWQATCRRRTDLLSNQVSHCRVVGFGVELTVRTAFSLGLSELPQARFWLRVLRSLKFICLTASDQLSQCKLGRTGGLQSTISGFRRSSETQPGSRDGRLEAWRRFRDRRGFYCHAFGLPGSETLQPAAALPLMKS